jgi:hypothetical protein
MIELRKPEQGRITGKVVSRSGRKHTVEADDGRILRADSAIYYPPESRVIILADAIIGPAGPAPVVLSFQE